MGYEIVYRDLLLFLASVFFGMCFFVNSTLGFHGCLSPAYPTGDGKFVPRHEHYNVNDSVIYGCSPQRHLFGSLSRTCLSNGTWSASLPYCARKRDLKQINEENRKYDILFDGNSETCIHIKNNQQGSIFIKINGKHKRIIVQIVSNRNENYVEVYYTQHNGEHRLFNFVQGKRASTLYSLQFSYRSSDSSTLQDSTIGIALNSCYRNYICEICEVIIFTDIIASCPWLYPENTDTFISYDKKPPNAQFMFEYGSAAKFTCSEGFYLVGNETRRCSDNSRWTGINTFCEAIVCSQKPPSVQNAFWLGWQDTKTYYFNHSLKGACEDGYRIHNQNPIATCNSKGVWSIEPSGIPCQEISCSERPPELKNANWSSWENGKAYPVNSTLKAICKHDYINYSQHSIITCSSIGTWYPEFLQDPCQAESTFSSRSTVVVAVAVVGLLFVILCLGLCIFWIRCGINKRSQKRAYIAEVLLENPIYNSTSSSLQGEDYITAVYLQRQTKSKDSNKHYPCLSNKEVTNEIYLTECPIAKAVHAYNCSVYEEIHNGEQSEPSLKSHSTDERAIQEVVVENEIYGT